VTGFEEDDATEVIESFSPGAFFADAYRIDAMLGGGASSQVYAATNVHTEKHVALKVLRRERQTTRADADEQRARFAREGEILSALVHPAIVRIFELGSASNGTPFIAMEALDGETLARRLAREKSLPLETVLRLVAFAADAIDHAHALGIVHRDIKPENLFLPRDGGVPVKVLDFGLSRVVDPGQRLTATGTTIGTPRYMPAEQIISARDAGPAVDVYALAVCAYEALAGTSPFDAADQAQLLGAILHGRRKPLRTRRPELPAAVDAVLDKAMSTRVAERHASAVELAAALYRAAQRAPDADAPEAVRHAALDTPAVVAAPSIPAPDPSRPDPVAVARAEVAARLDSGMHRVRQVGLDGEGPRFSHTGTPAPDARTSQPSARTSVPSPTRTTPLQWTLLGVGAIAMLGLGVLGAWLLFG
jgi:serine/threonine-protein kinase